MIYYLATPAVDKHRRSTFNKRQPGSRRPLAEIPLHAGPSPVDDCHHANDEAHHADSASSAERAAASYAHADPSGFSAPPAAPAQPVAAPGVQTRLQKGIRQPKKYTDGIVRYVLLTSTGEPTKLNEALVDPK
jgi:hypothetical protein